MIPLVQQVVSSGSSSSSSRASSVRQLPLSFEANQGQTDSQVRFLAHGPGYTLFLTPQESLLALSASKHGPAASKAPLPPGVADPSSLISSSAPSLIGMQFSHANPHPVITGEHPLPGIVNYVLGSNPATWLTNLPTFAQIRYHSIYPGIDLLYNGAQGNLEYTFVVAPGSDPSQIHLNFTGVKHLGLDARGELLLRLPAGTLQEDAPLVYQEINGARRQVASSYVLQSTTGVGFQLGVYDASKPLVIDPAVLFATYLGGVNNDDSTSLAVDSQGNAYITGATSSTNFPSQNALQPTAGGGPSDAFVTKINAAGTAMVYSTYLGGSGADWGAGIAVDGAGNAYITGGTSSANFPTQNALQSANAGTKNTFVTEVNAAGTALVYSTYLGGSGADWGTGITVDGAGNAYITGVTNSTNFPTQNALQAAFGGGSDDVFIAEIHAVGTALVYSTYLGGSGADWGTGIAVDGAGNAYITGGTSSTNFPTQSALQSANAGTANAFVTRINAAGTALVYSTYLGGSTYDYASGIALDSAGDAYVTGSTRSTNFPTHNPLKSANAGGGDAFVTKINAAGSALVYSTYLGGSGADWGAGIAVDGVGNAYITGSTRSTNFPTANPLESTNSGGADAFVTEIIAAGNAFLYSSYLGGSGDEEGTGIAVGSAGSVYVTGATASSNLPTAQPIQGYGGMEEGFLEKMTLQHDPSSGGSLSTYPVHTVAGDFNGDGKADIASFYNYGNNQIKAWVWPGTTSTSWSVTGPVWDSGVNFWNWNDVTFVAGDFDGDGKTDIMAIHNEGGARTTFWLFKGTATGLAAPVQVWESGVGNFDWNQAKFVAGDFNGDGKADVVAFYNNGSAQTTIWLWAGTSRGLGAPSVAWASGVGSFDWNQVKLVAGDVNGDGKADVVAFYNYGNAQTKAWLWPGAASGLGAPSVAWASGVGSFDWNQVKLVAGDFNGDGKADVVAFYNYGNAQTKAWLWPGAASGLGAPSIAWASGVGSFDWNQVKLVAGDVNGDGKADVVAFYNYGNAHTEAWLWPGTTASTLTAIGPVWDGGVNNWNWNNM